MSLIDDWDDLRTAIRSYLQAGGTAKALSDKTGVSRATILDWASRETAPETVEKGSAVMEALREPGY